jgi:16S rRNA (adenine1518-N6/adenine1519-N6)-dimethyltransferase
MPQSKHEIRELLSSVGTEPRKRFGQNFMIDQNLVRVVADAGMISGDDVVIEVGSGTGTLTQELLARAGRVIAVEIDRDLIKVLKETLGSNPKFELIEGDALAGKHGLNEQLIGRLQRDTGVSPVREALDDRRTSHGRDARVTIKHLKLVANLPYNIASPLVIELLLAGVGLLAFTVQKEVADRLRAAHNDESYGPLSVIVQMLSRVEVLRTLPPQAFWPAPKVESALVRMTRDDRLGPRAREFSVFVHQIFGFRRKTLRKAMSQAGYDPKILDKLGIDPQLRPENLTPSQFLDLFHASAV